VVVVVVGGGSVVVVVGGGSVVVVATGAATGTVVETGRDGDGAAAAGFEGAGAGDATSTACGAAVGAAGRASSARANPRSCWRCDSWADMVTSRWYSCETSSALLKVGAFARGGPARAKPAPTPTTASVARINFETMRSPL